MSLLVCRSLACNPQIWHRLSSKGIASLMYIRECGQVRRKQTRRFLRFLSLTLAIGPMPLSLLQSSETSLESLFPTEEFLPL